MEIAPSWTELICDKNTPVFIVKSTDGRFPSRMGFGRKTGSYESDRAPDRYVVTLICILLGDYLVLHLIGVCYARHNEILLRGIVCFQWIVINT